MKELGLRRFWSLVPLAKVPFWNTGFWSHSQMEGAFLTQLTEEERERERERQASRYTKKTLRSLTEAPTIGPAVAFSKIVSTRKSSGALCTLQHGSFKRR